MESNNLLDENKINSTLHKVLQGISYISKSETDIFDLICIFFAISLFIFLMLACIECLNTIFIDKSRKKNRDYFQKLDHHNGIEL